MEIPADEFKELSRRLQKVEAEMSSIYSLLNQIGIIIEPNLTELKENPESAILKQLFKDGVWREPTDDEKIQARKWQDLPDSEKESVISELENLKLERALSEIIILNRAGGKLK